MTVALKIAGQLYQRWSSIRITRGLKRCVSDIELETVGELQPAVLPFQPFTVSDDNDLLLTGYIVSVNPMIGAKATMTRIIGQSKTQDLVDCMLLGIFETSQFNGSTLDAIARAVAAPFGIGVTVAAPVGDAFPDATFGSESVFAYLERLARQRGVLLTDDQNGNLVLTTLGTGRAPGSLAMGQGGNIAEARGELNGKGRHSKYTVLSQAGMWATGSAVQVDIVGQAGDGGVPRFRPWATLAESTLLPGDAQKRAAWEAAHRVGEAVKASLVVPEWRAGGTLWQQNELVRCTVPRLALDDEFLIGEIEYREDNEGRRTTLTVAPPSAFTPEPESAALGAGAASAWSGVIKVVPGAS